MRPLRLDESLLTGDETVDTQHREIVALVDRMLEAEEAGHGEELLAHALEHLAAYASSHFACEQNLMEKYGFPAEQAEEHIADHRDLTERTRDFVLSYRAGEVSTVKPLIEFLLEWLDRHIANVDRKLVEYVQSTAQGRPDGCDTEAQGA